MFKKIRVYRLLIKASLKKALLSSFYSALIVFLGSLAAQLRDHHQITIITIVTALLSALVTFLVELRERNKGQTPLCCFETKKLGSQIVVTCGWLREWLTPEDFKMKCLGCQGEISEKLGVG